MSALAIFRLKDSLRRLPTKTAIFFVIPYPPVLFCMKPMVFGAAYA